MIKYPFLKEQPSTRQVVDTFKGYNHNLRIGSGEFFEMENMTSDDYPVLSPRGKRGLVTVSQDSGYGIGAIYVPETGVFLTMNHQVDHSDEEYGALYLLTSAGTLTQVCASLTAGRKSLALMGKYIIIAPDMVKVDIEDLDYGEIEYTKEISTGNLYLELCREDGTAYPAALPLDTAPSNPSDGDFWRDSSADPCVLKQYSSTQQEWVVVNSTYVRIAGSGLDGHNFYPQDGVTISGLGVSGEEIINSRFDQLNGSHVICSCGSSGIVIEGMIDVNGAHTCSSSSVVKIERKTPKLEFIVESGNRLWGCAKDTNEIYACKLGDFRNWNCFAGLSTDSWVGSIGTPGEFTGAAVQNGYPIFYKENCKHKVWPSSTGAHQITSTPCDGVEKGSENSLAVMDGTVFYKSPFGVFADDGGGAVEIGRSLGDARYHDASGAIYDRKYYLSMADSTGKHHLFVYDISRKLWHREDSPTPGVLVSGGGSLYAAAGGEIWDLTGKTGTPEEKVSWMVETGDLGLELPEQKYISRLTLRLSLEPGATLEIYAKYDYEPFWVKLGQVYGTNLRSFSLPVRPRRCDQLRLKLQGTGMCKVYSITKTLEKGSELT